MISIFERSTRNSGIIGGKFLEKTRVPKPGSSVEKPEYYTPADFSIGATVEGIDSDITSCESPHSCSSLMLFCSVLFAAVFHHRFVLMDADRYVLRYLESLYNHVPEHTLSSLRQRFGVSQTSDQEEQHEGKNFTLKSLFACGLYTYNHTNKRFFTGFDGSMKILWHPWNLSISQKVL